MRGSIIFLINFECPLWVDSGRLEGARIDESRIYDEWITFDQSGQSTVRRQMI